LHNKQELDCENSLNENSLTSRYPKQLAG